MALIVSRSDVRRILEAGGEQIREDLLARIEAGHREMAEGTVRQHSRIYLRYPEDAGRRPPGLFTMSALLPQAGIMGTRLLGLSGTGGDGLLVLFDHATQKCLAIIDDSLLHEYRTGAPAAIASRYLAPRDSHVLACIGSSGIARGALTMTCHALPDITTVRVYSPNDEHRRRFADEMSTRLHLPVEPATSAETAATGADIIITATDADKPVLQDDCVGPNAHISMMARNEISKAVLAQSTVFTGWLQGDHELDPPVSDRIPQEWIRGELSDLVTGSLPGRSRQNERTVFLSGMGPSPVWDVAAAAAIYDAARGVGCGVDLDIAG